MWNTILVIIGVWFLFQYLKKFFRKPRQLSDRVVLITGAGGGLGTCLCKALAAEKSQLICVDVNEKATNHLAEQVRAEFPNVKLRTYTCDVASESEVQSLAKNVLADVGHVDIVISNAGIINAERLQNFDADIIKKTLSVNVLAQFWMTRAFFPSMETREGSLFVAISSIAGIRGAAHMIPYCTSKFAVTGFMRSLQRELRVEKSKIQTLSIHPSFMKTPMLAENARTSALRVTDPEDAAALIVSAMKSRKTIQYIPKELWYIAVLADLFPAVANIYEDSLEPLDYVRK